MVKGGQGPIFSSHIPWATFAEYFFLFFPHVSRFPKLETKAIPALKIGRCLLVGRLIIFSLPVMKVATGVSAPGTGGGERWAVYPPQGPAPHVFCLVCDL